jgi:hypothetical protein
MLLGGPIDPSIEMELTGHGNKVVHSTAVAKCQHARSRKLLTGLSATGHREGLLHFRRLSHALAVVIRGAPNRGRAVCWLSCVLMGRDEWFCEQSVGGARRSLICKLNYIKLKNLFTLFILSLYFPYDPPGCGTPLWCFYHCPPGFSRPQRCWYSWYIGAVSREIQIQYLLAAECHADG